MNTLNMPGFTAEASLYETNNYYKLAAIWSKGSKNHLVPQQFLSIGDWWRSKVCIPKCGPCRDIGSNVLYQTCVNFDCTRSEVQCLR